VRLEKRSKAIRAHRMLLYKSGRSGGMRPAAASLLVRFVPNGTKRKENRLRARRRRSDRAHRIRGRTRSEGRETSGWSELQFTSAARIGRGAPTASSSSVGPSPRISQRGGDVAEG